MKTSLESSPDNIGGGMEDEETDMLGARDAEEELEESIEWFGLSTDAEDEPTVFDAGGWHRQ